MCLVKGKISHEKIKEIMRPSFTIAVFASVVTLLVSIFIFYELIKAGNIDTDVVKLGMFIHGTVTVLMLFSTFLLKQEHFCLAGSILLLCTSIIGVSFAVGIMIGPILGIIAGIMGMMEHEKLIKHHYL